jgi:hypothetical protein
MQPLKRFSAEKQHAFKEALANCSIKLGYNKNLLLAETNYFI